MRFAVTLILANKSDLPHALSADEVKAEVRKTPRLTTGPPGTMCPRAIDVEPRGRLCFRFGGRRAPRSPRAQLRLDQLADRTFHVQPSNGVNGDGLWEGMKWLAMNVKPI